MRAGLRIDVDTFGGTRTGVPALCRMLAGHGIRATFFFSVGPDNMGRHLWRLVRPAYLAKMLRTRAAGLYGWRILLRGTLWPGPLIGERLSSVIRAAADAGHEIGLHAWDHHAWQAHIERMDRRRIGADLRRSFDTLARIAGSAPSCSAVPGWKCSEAALQEKDSFPFRYNSDCRGETIFLPVVNGAELSRPQIPVTLPTYDEAIGRGGMDDAGYNEYILSLMKPERLNVLTVHAEVEGDSRRDLFADFLRRAGGRGVSFLPLGDLLAGADPLPRCEIERKEIEGREGWVACQKHGVWTGGDA